MTAQLLLVFKNVDVNLINNLKYYGNALAIDDHGEHKVALPLRLTDTQIFNPMDLIEIDPTAKVELGISDDDGHFMIAKTLTVSLAKMLPHMDADMLSISILTQLDDFLAKHRAEIDEQLNKAFVQVKATSKKVDKTTEKSKNNTESSKSDTKKKMNSDLQEQEFMQNYNDPYFALAVKLFDTHQHRMMPKFDESIRKQLGDTLVSAETTVANLRNTIVFEIYHRLKTLDVAKQIDLDTILNNFDEQVKLEDEKLLKKAQQLEAAKNDKVDTHETQDLKQQVQSLEFDLSRINSEYKQLKQNHDTEVADLEHEKFQLTKTNDALNQQLVTLKHELQEQQTLNQQQQTLQTKINELDGQKSQRKQKIFGWGIIATLVVLFVMLCTIMFGLFSHKEAPGNQTRQNVANSEQVVVAHDKSSSIKE